jgi:hypothetical protein
MLLGRHTWIINDTWSVYLMVWSMMPTDCLGSTTLCYRLEPIENRKSSRIGAGFGTLSAVRVPTSVPTGADRHTRVPTCADWDRRGRGLRGAVPPVPRGFVGTKFAVQGYSEVEGCPAVAPTAQTRLDRS